MTSLQPAPINVKACLMDGPLFDAAWNKINVADLFASPGPETWSEKPVELASKEIGGVKTVDVPTKELDWSNEKVIGLYFSAHWCPPCRQFTPHLGNIYNACKAVPNRNFEVIFCSNDRQDQEYTNYANSMPFARLPFQDRRTQSLSSAFGVMGIPCLVLIRARDGAVINGNARGDFLQDSGATGNGFPWNGSSGAGGVMGKVWTLVKFALFFFVLWTFVIEPLFK